RSCFNYCLYTFQEALVVIAGFEKRSDLAPDDPAYKTIRQGAFQAIAGSDPYFAIIDCSEYEYAVLFSLFPDFPFVPQFERIIGNVKHAYTLYGYNGDFSRGR